MKDLRFIGVGVMIKQGQIKRFEEIYDHIRITHLMAVTGANFLRIQMLKENPKAWTFGELDALAEAIDIELVELVELLHRSIQKS